MVQKQGGNITYLEDTDKFEKAKFIQKIKSDKDGKIKEIQADIIAKFVCELGAGRTKKEDNIDMSVGVILNKKVGDTVKKGDLLATVYSNSILSKDINQLLGIVY